MAKYKSMTHTQLADCAGVSRRTLYNWLRPLEKKLYKLGVRPKAKLLTPKAVQYICEVYSIDVD